VGGDAAGDDLLLGLRENGVDTRFVTRLPGPSGFATIVVAEGGENVIVLEGGANAAFTPAALVPEAFVGAHAALFQLEVPLETVLHGLALAREAGAITIVNAAPPDHAAAIPPALVDVLVVNRHEAARLLGERASGAGSEALLAGLARDYASVILTLGSQGALWARAGKRGIQRAHAAQALDTTGAGDTFTGAFAAAWTAGRAWVDALDFAAAAAALSVTREGAQASMPTLTEMQSLGFSPP